MARALLLVLLLSGCTTVTVGDVHLEVEVTVASTKEERKFAEWCRQQKGMECLKLLSPAGIPDRMVLMHPAMAIFIEFKNKGEKLRPLQQHWRKVLYEEMAFDHYVCTTFDQAKAVVRLVKGEITLMQFAEEMEE